MPSLMDLPSELLYDIIALIAASPLHAAAAGKRHRPEQLHRRAVICYPETTPAPSLLSLLSTNSQLRCETLLFLSKQPLIFDLDVVYIDGHWIWPRFTQIPAQCTSKTIERLNLNLVHCFTEEGRAGELEDRTMSLGVGEFLKVVSHFLVNGPFNNTVFDAPRKFIPRGPPTGFRDLRLNCLAINVDTIRQHDVDKVFSQADIPFREVVGLAHMSFDPLYPVGVDNCSIYMGNLPIAISWALHADQAGLVIRERVDKITYSVNGSMRKENNIAYDLKRGRERELAEYKSREGLGEVEA